MKSVECAECKHTWHGMWSIPAHDCRDMKILSLEKRVESLSRSHAQLLGILIDLNLIPECRP